MKEQKVVVVLGAGRSGTSLTMSLAASLGVSMSTDLVGPGINNQKGAFEDVRIVRISRAILRHFHRNGAALSYLPLPDGWLDDPFVKHSRAELLQIVSAQTDGSRVWGFKEPVTAKLLPLWHTIFAELNIQPIYVLSLRSPAGVNTSFYRAYGVPRHVSTLVWMSRYVDAIVGTDCNFEIFDYDEWFSAPEPALIRLAACMGVEFDEKNVKIAKIIDQSIRTTDTLEDSGAVAEAVALYRVLMAYKDGSSSRDDVLAAASAATAYMDGFAALSYSVDTLGAKLDNTVARLESQLDRCNSNLERSRSFLEREESRANELSLRLIDPVGHMLARRSVPKVDGQVIAGVASFPARAALFAQAIASVYAQFDHIYVYLNGYEEIPLFLKRNKITVFQSRDYLDLSANGKVFSLGAVDDCYFFTIDDDIMYPHDYVQKMLACMQRYDNKVAVCVHGSVFPEKPEWYYERTALYPFQSELETDRFVTLIGSGTFAFHTAVLKARFEDFLPNVMVDLRFSILAKEQGVPLVSLARPKMWLRALAQGEGLYQDFLFKRTIHTDKVIEYAPWGFDIYSSIVRNILPKNLLQLSAEELRAGQYDVEFIRALHSGDVPPDWGDTELYRAKLEQREFVKKPVALYRASQRKLRATQHKHRATQSKLKQIYSSRAFQAARFVALAVRQPVWNLPLLPARLIRLAIKGGRSA